MRSLFLGLLVLACPAGNLMAHDLDWKNLLLATLKLRHGLDYDANVDSYMQVFRPDVWNRYRNDEFEMVSKRKETIELMKQAIERFSIQEPFVVRTSTRIGSYEFDSKSFPLDGWSESSYFYASNYPHGDFPSSIEVFISNPQVVKRLAMSEVQAKEFVRNRKDRHGEINRMIYVKLNLKITKVKAEPDELLAEITKYWLYADANYSKLLYEFDLSKVNEAAVLAAKADPTPKKSP
jgi:Domain of unknown function (DUF4852)